MAWQLLEGLLDVSCRVPLNPAWTFSEPAQWMQKPTDAIAHQVGAECNGDSNLAVNACCMQGRMPRWHVWLEVTQAC